MHYQLRRLAVLWSASSLPLSFYSPYASVSCFFCALLRFPSPPLLSLMLHCRNGSHMMQPSDHQVTTLTAGLRTHSFSFSLTPVGAFVVALAAVPLEVVVAICCSVWACHARFGKDFSCLDLSCPHVSGGLRGAPGGCLGLRPPSVMSSKP